MLVFERLLYFIALIRMQAHFCIFLRGLCKGGEGSVRECRYLVHGHIGRSPLIIIVVFETGGDD